ncbi:hypothetical protein P0136_08170 [Lentisphaerota bacterium ZTH]|nr:hypothetical protein JYG24_00720 [Lentisphaerota bacterium]WET05339.1 hypothetical protein P0136_08170 [Lentisphaerota bacterium ZTH]
MPCVDTCCDNFIKGLKIFGDWLYEKDKFITDASVRSRNRIDEHILAKMNEMWRHFKDIASSVRVADFDEHIGDIEVFFSRMQELMDLYLNILKVIKFKRNGHILPAPRNRTEKLYRALDKFYYRAYYLTYFNDKDYYVKRCKYEWTKLTSNFHYHRFGMIFFSTNFFTAVYNTTSLAIDMHIGNNYTVKQIYAMNILLWLITIPQTLLETLNLFHSSPVMDCYEKAIVKTQLAFNLLENLSLIFIHHVISTCEKTGRDYDTKGAPIYILAILPFAVLVGYVLFCLYWRIKYHRRSHKTYVADHTSEVRGLSFRARDIESNPEGVARHIADASEGSVSMINLKEVDSLSQKMGRVFTATKTNEQQAFDAVMTQCSNKAGFKEFLDAAVDERYQKSVSMKDLARAFSGEDVFFDAEESQRPRRASSSS